MKTEKLIRVSKILSNRGICSRREADHLISKGFIKVNGKVASLGDKANLSDRISIFKYGKKELKRKQTFLLNKPVGFVSSQPTEYQKPAVQILTNENQDKNCEGVFKKVHLSGLAPAGRLDLQSEGLLVLTQNGLIAKKLIGENNSVEKEYLVTFKGNLSEEALKKLNYGIALDNEILKPAKVSIVESEAYVLNFILQQGKKRQIRRACELVGLEVLKLERVRIGNIKLGNLKSGQWRFLKENEEF